MVLLDCVAGPLTDRACPSIHVGLCPLATQAEPGFSLLSFLSGVFSKNSVWFIIHNVVFLHHCFLLRLKYGNLSLSLCHSYGVHCQL
jgi:hypothetical protein